MVQIRQADVTSSQAKNPAIYDIASLYPRDLFKDNLEEKRPVTVTISKPIEQVFEFLRDFKNHGLFMKNVTVTDEVYGAKSIWRARVDGRDYNWVTEITEQRPNELIAWKGAGDFDHVGAIVLTKASGGRGTVVSMKVSDDLGGEGLSGLLGKLALKDADARSYAKLRRLKAFLETGEVPTVEGQPSGRDEDSETQKH